MSLSFKTVAPGAGTMPRMQNPKPATHPATATRPCGELPGPAPRWWGLPLRAAMRRDYLGYGERLHRTHGDSVRSHILGERLLDVFHPDLLREAMVDNADALIRWERGPEVFAELVGQSVLVTEGTLWERQRRMLMPAFAPKRVAGYAALMAEAAIAGLDTALPPSQSQADVEMDDLFSRLTMDAIHRTLFGAPLPDDSGTAIQALRIASETGFREMFWPTTLPDWLPLPGKAAKRRALRRLRALIAEAIAHHARQPPAPAATDLLTMLQTARDETTGTALSAQEVFDQCMLSFQAGHETSATAFLWWSGLLATHPHATERATAEVDRVLNGRTPGPEALARLPWLVATLKEAMRLYPPIAALLTRRTTRTIAVGGYSIPSGTLLRATPWVLHRSARWFAQPDAFRPERFLPDAPPPPRGAYLPFGLGPRVCLGQHFALLEMTIVAALLLQRYRLTTLPDSRPPHPLLHVTLRPATPVRLRLTRR
ncbi:MAG: cytochrome P450 [Burkholderiales bacterium]|jgi:cytochrome P450|nr:cytochrome P450 [Burkholderiales bacterium]